MKYIWRHHNISIVFTLHMNNTIYRQNRKSWPRIHQTPVPSDRLYATAEVTICHNLPLKFSEIGYLMLPSRDMAEIPLKRRKSSIQPTTTNRAHCAPLFFFQQCLLVRIRLYRWRPTIRMTEAWRKNRVYWFETRFLSLVYL